MATINVGSTVSVCDLHSLMVPELSALERLSRTHPWSERMLNDSLQAGAIGLVLQSNEELLAYGLFSVVLDCGDLLNICVRRKVQNQGLGGVLLDALMVRAKQAGVVNLQLEVRQSSRIAQALYIRRGFEEQGVRPDYYRTTLGREDALLMGKCLGTAGIASRNL